MSGLCDKNQCPCNHCIALLPTPTLLTERSLKAHKQRYGIPLYVGACESVEGAHDSPVAPVDSPAPERAQPFDESLFDETAFAKDLVLLTINNGISWKATELIVKLVNSHVHGRLLAEELPATTYQLKQITKCRPGHTKLLHLCRQCDFVFAGAESVCTPCGMPPRTRVPRQLLVNDVRPTISQLFSVPKLAEALEYACHRIPGDGDVWDGDIMKDIPLGINNTFCYLW